MARKRMISPEFFTSLPVNSLKVDAAMTFIGIWCYCDDDGRGEDDLDLIKAAIWPRRREMTTRRIAKHLDEIEERGLICRYVLNGHPLLHCPSWSEHQKPSHPTASRIAPCPIHESDAYEEFMGSDDHRRAKYRDLAGVIRESFASASRGVRE